MNAGDFFDLPKSLSVFAHFFPLNEPPWLWLENIEKALIACGHSNALGIRHNFFKKVKKLFSKKERQRVGKNVYIAKDVHLPVTCIIEDNVYIGTGTQIHNGALIRQNVIIGENCVIGNACEIKNALIMDNVRVAHFNYVGDSILGSRSHLSAGAILSNLRFDERPISFRIGDEKITTKRRKCGAILGENAQIGCNAVLLPGTLIGKDSIVSTGTVFGGFLEDHKIVRTQAKNVIAERRL
ncbi:MAG: UDP-N-acetylglucosamine diphosphorylase [Puniceicoccales bacterium]|jgi:NDP-sugar pyrophosphorylase family protein|nr:UDP-N-acetylglucosamine diphosphorylase [Puniceicoccales bacterium]